MLLHRYQFVLRVMLAKGLTLLAVLIAAVATTNVTIAIIGTNDIHGTAFPALLQRADTGEEYYYGGLPILGTLMNIIKDQHPGNVLYLDGGDQFQGGIESSKLISSGKIMNDFYGIMKINGSAIGNHQFDFGPEFLFPFMSAKDAPNLAANLRSEHNKVDFLPKQKSSQMYSFASGIKIGVIGLATLQTPETTAGFEKKLFPDYKFLEYKEIVIAEAAKLRKSGANAVLLVGHVGNSCVNNFDYGNWTKDSQQPECAPGDQMTVLLRSLPKGTIQGVIQGHRHTVSHVFIDGIPVIGNINGGYYFNVMYLTFASKTLVDSKIEGPIPVCEKVFQNTKKCNYMDPDAVISAGPLVNWRFHNKEVYPEPKINTIYQEEWLPKMKPFLVSLASNQIFLTRFSDRECQLANLVTTLMHQNFTDADFAVLNIGGLRTDWVPGVIQEQHFYNMFPFENIIQSFNISGDELLKTLDVLQSGSKGLYAFYGIQTTVQKVGSRFKFVSAKMMDGSEIDPNKFYRGLASDFLLGGGDDFHDVIGKIYTPRDVISHGDFRDSLRPGLIGVKTIKKGSLIDPENPRIIIQS